MKDIAAFLLYAIVLYFVVKAIGSTFLMEWFFGTLGRSWS